MEDFKRAGSATLLSLPVEIIQRIATLCPCSTALRLLQVNRQLRAHCNTKVVFEQIARYHHLQSGAAAGAAPWQPAGLFEQATLPDTVRIALAVERACEWALFRPSTDRDAQRQAHQSSAAEWLPYLMVLHHPASLQVNLESVTSLLLRHDPSRPPAPLGNPGSAFCFAVRALAQPPSPALVPPADLLRTIISPLHRDLTLGYALSERLQFRPADYSPMPCSIHTWHSLAMIGALAVTVVQIHGIHGLSLPDPARIPFASLIDAPALLGNTGADFDGSYLPTMTAPEFLADGQWTGVYSDLRWGGNNDRFGLGDPPMRPMWFTCMSGAAARSPGIRAFITSSSGSWDGIGDFTIRGTIYESGAVRLRKWYVTNGFHWDWCGTVTPLGIAGLWGDEGGQTGGYFWLWKTEWCR